MVCSDRLRDCTLPFCNSALQQSPHNLLKLHPLDRLQDIFRSQHIYRDQFCDALIEEGFVREIISKVQTMRKEAGFDVTDHITLYEDGSEKLRAIMDSHAAEIKAAVLCDLVIFGVVEGYAKEWDINGETVTLAVKKSEGK